jgi:hypothetical protein
MFKLADGYLSAFNAKVAPERQLQRSYINGSFDAFRKKKGS